MLGYLKKVTYIISVTQSNPTTNLFRETISSGKESQWGFYIREGFEQTPKPVVVLTKKTVKPSSPTPVVRSF